MDHLSCEKRSENMRRIRGRNTAPELFVRRLIHNMGYRYRLYYDLPGKPDIVFVKMKKVIFVHGCFWHHHGCKLSRMPKSNMTYWENKLNGIASRDRRNILMLQKLGWDCLIIWQCNLEDSPTKIKKTLEKYLS